MQKIKNILLATLSGETPYLTVMLSFLGMVCLRVFTEHFLAISAPVSPYETVIELIHDSYFFALTFLAIWIFLSLLLKIKPQKLSRFFLWGSFLILLPPIIDMLRTQGAVFWSFYILNAPFEIIGNFLTFFGQLPPGIVYFGTKIIFFVAILIATLLTYVWTKSYLKTIIGFLGSYFILFFMGAFPSFFFYVYSLVTGERTLAEIRSFQIAQFFASQKDIFGIAPEVSKYIFVYNLNFLFFPLLIFLLLVFFFLNSQEKIIAVAKNIRPPQTIYHGGMFFIGMGLAYLNYPQNFQLTVFSFGAALTLLICVCLSWIASVFFNDLTDLEIDRVSNPERPLPKKVFEKDEYAKLGIFCFILALFGSLSVGFSFAVLIFVYQFIAWLYSSATFRLKKFPGIATFVSAIASLMILFVGYILLSDNQTIAYLSWRIILLLLITYTLSLPIKDFKDIAGDKKDGVLTLPVLLGEKKGRLLVSVNMFLSYMLSVFFLNELGLFFWALAFGAINFLVVTNEKIKPRNLPAWTLGVVSTYTLILVWIVFI